MEKALAGGKRVGTDTAVLILFGGLFFGDWLLAPYVYVDVLIACEWLAFVGWIMYCHPLFFIRYILAFFWAGGNLAGVFICENTELWLYEVEVFSHRADSLGLISFAWFLWLTTMFVLEQRWPYRMEPDSGAYAWKLTWRGKPVEVLRWIPYVMIGLVAVLFFHVWEHPAFLEKIDRFAFRMRYLDGIWNHLANLCYFLCPLILLLWFRGKKRRAVLSLGLYGVFLFWTGEKFGRYWNCFVWFCLLFSVFCYSSPVKHLRKRLLLFMSGIVCLMGIAFLHQMFRTNYPFASYIFQRTAQQGQLWWRTYDLDKNHSFRLEEMKDETEVFFRLDDHYDKKHRFGIYKIMRYVAPREKVERHIAHGAAYSTSNHATYLYYFKEWGVLFFSVVSGAVLWGALRMWMYFVGRGMILESILATRCLGIMYNVLAASHLNWLLSYKGVFYFSVLAALLCFRYLYRFGIWRSNGQMRVSDG